MVPPAYSTRPTSVTLRSVCCWMCIVSQEDLHWRLSGRTLLLDVGSESARAFSHSHSKSKNACLSSASRILAHRPACRLQQSRKYYGYGLSSAAADDLHRRNRESALATRSEDRQGTCCMQHGFIVKVEERQVACFCTVHIFFFYSAATLSHSRAVWIPLEAPCTSSSRSTPCVMTSQQSHSACHPRAGEGADPYTILPSGPTAALLVW